MSDIGDSASLIWLQRAGVTLAALYVTSPFAYTIGYKFFRSPEGKLRDDIYRFSKLVEKEGENSFFIKQVFSEYLGNFVSAENEGQKQAALDVYEQKTEGKIRKYLVSAGDGFSGIMQEFPVPYEVIAREIYKNYRKAYPAPGAKEKFLEAIRSEPDPEKWPELLARVNGKEAASPQSPVGRYLDRFSHEFY